MAATPQKHGTVAPPFPKRQPYFSKAHPLPIRNARVEDEDGNIIWQEPNHER